MIKLQILGNIGKDSVVQVHGTDSVVNFSVCHTDKWKDGRGQLMQKSTWVDCSWWLDSQSPVIQYLKKGQMVFVEGIPGSRGWEGKEGKVASGLTMRVHNVQLCGGSGKREDQENQPSQQAPAQSQNNNSFDSPHTINSSDDELPF